MVTGTGRKPDVPRSPAQMARFDGEIWIFFRADLPESKKRFPSWAGAEKFAVDLIFGEKNGILVKTPTDRSDQPSLRSMKGVTVVTQ